MLPPRPPRLTVWEPARRGTPLELTWLMVSNSVEEALPQRSRRRRQLFGAVVFGGLVAGVAALGTLAMRGRGRPGGLWYRALRKSRVQPPGSVFGPVWSALYGMIAYAGYRIWRSPPSRARTGSLALWGTQLALNGAWTPLFFGARRPKLALADLVALDVAAGAFTALARRVDARASVAMIPYLAWISFATVLNGQIVAKNPDVLLSR